MANNARRRLATLFVLIITVATSCDDLGPGGSRLVQLSVAPSFASRQAGLVPVTAARILVTRQNSGTVAADTTVAVTSDTVDVSVAVAVGDADEVLLLTLALIGTANDTVFRGGPMQIAAAAVGAEPIVVGIVYTGTGADADSVVITSTPPSLFSGQTFTHQAVVFVGNQVIPGTPIAWLSLDPANATVPDRSTGNIVAGNQRGTARIVAELLNGPADTTTVTVQPTPGSALLVSGGGQVGPTGAALPTPITIQVLGTDGLPVQGAVVRFNGDGVFQPDSALTNATGNVATSWTLGATGGIQMAVASVDGSTVSVAFSATATTTTGSPTQLVFIAQPITSVAGVIPPVVVDIRDTAGVVVTSFNDSISMGLGVNPSGTQLGGRTTVAAVGGVATFDSLVVTTADVGYALDAFIPSFLLIRSDPFDVIAGPATTLSFVVNPSTTVVSNTIAPAIQVAATDPFGNINSAFFGIVTLTIAANPGGGQLQGTTSVGSASGVATFSNISIDQPGSGYLLSAQSAPDLTGISNSFDITTASGVVRWINPAGGLWSGPANWSTGVVPAASDTVLIDQPGIYSVTVDQNATVAQLTVGVATGAQTLSLGANTITVGLGGGTINAGGIVDQTGGNMTMTGPFFVNGTYTWNAGNLAGGGTGSVNVTTTGLLNLSGGAARTLDAIAVNNDGSFSYSAIGTITVTNGGLLNNLVNGTISLVATSGNFLQGAGATGAFTNAGLLDRSVGTGVVLFGVPFVNADSVHAGSGTLQFNNGGGSSGPIFVADGANLFLAGTHGISGAVTGGGTFTLLGGIATFNGQYSLDTTIVGSGVANFSAVAPDTAVTNELLFTGGAIGGIGTLHVTTSATWDGTGNFLGSGTTRIGPAAILIVEGTGARGLDTRVIDNEGTVDWTMTGQLNLSNAATINNQVGGSFNATAASATWFHNTGGFTTFNNLGTLTRSTGAGSFSIGANLINSGTIDIQTGALTLTQGGTFGGSATVASGATLDLSSNGTVSYNLLNGFATAGLGVFRLSGVTATMTSSTPAIATFDRFTQTGGTLSGDGTVIVTASHVWDGGTIDGGPSAGVLRILNTATSTWGAGVVGREHRNRIFQNQGIVAWTGNTTASGDGAVFDNQAGATFDIQSNLLYTFNLGGAIPRFDNSGTVLRNGALDATVELPLNNLTGGVVNVRGIPGIQNGGLNLTAGGTSDGVYTTSDRGDLRFNGGIHTLSSTATIGGLGNVFFTNGTVVTAGKLDIASVVIDGGTVQLDYTGAGAPDTNWTTAFNQSSGTLTGAGVFGLRTPSNPSSWTGGTWSGTGTTFLDTASTFVISGAAAKTIDTRTLDTKANLTWDASGTGTLTLANGALVRNFMGANFDIQAVATIAQGVGAPGSFVNVGNLLRSLGAGVFSFNVPFSNTGSALVNPATGTLDFNGTFSHTGSINGGTATIDIVDATLGTMTGGWSPGGFNNAGALTVNRSGGTLAPAGFVRLEVGGRNPGIDLDQFIVTGTLDVTNMTLASGVFNAFVPTALEQFTVATATSILGTLTNLSLPLNWTAAVVGNTIVLTAPSVP